MKHVLILEDTLLVVAVLVNELSKLEREIDEAILVTVYSSSQDVERIVNSQDPDSYDVIILDRNAKDGGSFHILNIEKFGPKKVISISSLPHLNQAVKARGISHIVNKDHARLEEFASEVSERVKGILNN